MLFLGVGYLNLASLPVKFLKSWGSKLTEGKRDKKRRRKLGSADGQRTHGMQSLTRVQWWKSRRDTEPCSLIVAQRLGY
jgi:hypothetical protein